MLVFSYFADTVDWISDRFLNVVEHDERLAAYRGRVASTSGRHGPPGVLAGDRSQD